MNGFGQVTSTGVQIRTNSPRRLFVREAEAKSAGEHLWVLTGAWELSPAAIVATRAGEPAHLDVENLLTVDGPGCFICEQEWTPQLAGSRCPGEPA